MKVLYISLVKDGASEFVDKIEFVSVPSVGSVFEFWSKTQKRVVAGEVLGCVEIDGTNCVSVQIQEASPSGLVAERQDLFASFAPDNELPQACQNVRGRNVDGDVL